MLPKSVIQFMGGEGFENFTFNTVEGMNNQFDFTVRDEEAWKSIGMKTMSFDTYTQKSLYDGATYGYMSANPVPANAIMTFFYPGGQHCQTTWEQEFGLALPYLYRPSPTDPQRPPPQQTLKYVSPTIGHDDQGGGGGGADAGVITAAVLGSLFGVMIAFFLFTKYYTKQAPSLKNRDVYNPNPLNTQASSSA
jgi:hypothetical protein